MKASQGPEARKSVGRLILVEPNDGFRRPCLEALRGELEGTVVGPPRRDRFLDPLQEGTQDEPVDGSATLGSPPKSCLLRNRPKVLDGRRGLSRQDEEGPAGGHVRMEERFRLERGGRVGVTRLGLAPLPLG